MSSRAERATATGATGRRAAASATAAEKRRVILDAAVRVFARQGFHTCRVSDIADEAGVAYGLVYHYFSSKEAILDTLFLDRWDVMLAAIAETDRTDRTPREKLHAVAGFIIDSYRHDPELMKVIIVEVTRAANTFGLRHVDKIRDAYAGIAAIVAAAQDGGEFRADITPEFAAQAFYGSVEQVLTSWIFDNVPVADAEFDRAKAMIVETICDGLARHGAASGESA
jgi:TetR/AcrR family transcriptional regulator, fatty acid metabolism regulator protein